jgi:hypothetical protein
MSAWHEVNLKGSEKAIRAFVAGLAGTERGMEVVFLGDLDVAPESFGERLRGLFAAGTHHGVLAPAAVSDALVAAVEAHGADAGIAVERRRVMESASFTFRVEAYARDVARELRAALVESLPEGVRVEDLVERKEEHPDARGAELYARLHEFVYHATGRVEGALPGVLEMWRRARELDFAEGSALTLRGRDL